MPITKQPSDVDYINYLIAARCDVSCVKVADCYSTLDLSISHDSFNRFLSRQSLTTEALWNEVERYVDRKTGWLVFDNTVLDKNHSKKIECTYFQWSGKHRKVVRGIGLITLIWTDGIVSFPIDYRIYDKDVDEKTKNDHFQEMALTAYKRGFNPSFIMFDSWYSGNENLKFINRLGWYFFTRVKKNWMVNPDALGNVQVSTISIPEDGLEVHLKKHGFIRVFHSYNRKGASRYWATNFIPLNGEDRLVLQSIFWTIENYHRAIKELCGVEKCQARKAEIQQNHINCSLRAYLRLEVNNLLNGVTPYNAQWQITKVGISEYIKDPKYALNFV
ncbi:MAG: transposase [Methanospirillaceae archaeon]|nr:transposase [Methanospirillaceae archaeon]